MTKNNKITVILLLLAILLLLPFTTYLLNRIIKLENKIDVVQTKLDSACEQQTITQGILNAHLNNTLSDDRGGE